MKQFLLVICFVLVTSFAYADNTARISELEAEKAQMQQLVEQENAKFQQLQQQYGQRINRLTVRIIKIEGIQEELQAQDAKVTP